MLSFAKLAVLLALVAVIVGQASVKAAVMPSVCSSAEEALKSCQCCRKSCWDGIADMATAYFGHIPGQKNDAETKFTLALIRQCFITDCADVCPSPPPQ